MLLVPRHSELERLAYRIRLADAPSRDLIDDVAAACARFGALKQAGKLASFDTWHESGAWFDAALALVSTELPGWSVRRLVKDDDLWFCALSQTPNIPFDFDDVVEASHESMPLAVLAALVDAKLRLRFAAAPAAGATPKTKGAAGYQVCCDNFA